MASIRQRQKVDRRRSKEVGAPVYKTVWHVQVRMSGFPARTATFDTKRAAERWAKVTEAEMIEGRHFRSVEARRRTLGEAVDRYIESEVPKKRDGEMHTTTLNWWKEHLGSTTLSNVSPALIVEYRDKLRKRKYREKQLSNGRVNRYVACLRHMFTVARREWHWTTFNPLDGVSMLPENKGRVRYLSDDERSALLAQTATDSVLHVFVMLALTTACRAGELQKLTWADVDLKSGRLLFRETKNAEPRTAWAQGITLDLLKAHAKVRPIESAARVFQNSRGGVYEYHKQFKQCLTAAEIDDFHFHDLRHTSATYLAQAGATEQQLRAIGGWKSGIVSRYVHMAAEDAKAALSKLVDKVDGDAQNDNESG